VKCFLACYFIHQPIQVENPGAGSKTAKSVNTQWTVCFCLWNLPRECIRESLHWLANSTRVTNIWNCQLRARVLAVSYSKGADAMRNVCLNRRMIHCPVLLMC